MHRTMASAVDGNKVLVDGTWLKCIGNRDVQKGDFIWTDGRCVYGHNSEGGGSYVPVKVDGGIPVLREGWHDGAEHPYYMYFDKGKLNTIGQGNDLGKLLNRGNRFTFIDDYVLDAEYDSEGNLYTLEGSYIICDWATGNYVEQNGACVKRNGEVIATYDLLPYALSMIDEATPMAIGQTSPAGGDDPGSETYIYSFYCTTLSGKVDAQGNFKVVAHIIIEARHEEYAYHTEYGFFGGSDTYIFSNTGSAELCRRIFIDQTGNIEEWFKGYWLRWWTFSYRWGGAGKSTHSEGAWYAPNGSIRYPVHDGMYMTFSGTANFLNYPSDGGDYIASIYNEQNELVLTVKANPLNRLSLCQIGTGKYLVCTGYYLYLWDNGNLTELAHGCQNFRLRKMSNLKKWKREGGV